MQFLNSLKKKNTLFLYSFVINRVGKVISLVICIGKVNKVTLK